MHLSQFDPTSPALTDITREQLRKATASCRDMQLLEQYIIHGWPPTKEHLPHQLQAFWHFREELSVANGILLKSTRAIVPTSLRPSMLIKIHQSHRGAEYCLRFAREAIFWPNMSKDIETFCQMCPTCAQYGKQATTEPMLSHPTPTLPWQFVSQDIFEFEHKQYLITVDHFSDFYELDPLINTQSTTIVEITKAQRLMGRRTRSTLPLSENLLKPEPADPSTVSSEITLRREASKSHYDKYAQPPLSPLPLGSHAYAKPRPSQRGAPWLYGRVVDNPSPRSYNIDTGNVILRRNRAQLRPAAPPRNIPLQSPPLPSFQPILPETPVTPTAPRSHAHDLPPAAVFPQAQCHTPPPVTEPIPQHLEQQTSDSSPGPAPQTQEMQQTTRSGRPIRKPKKFEDTPAAILTIYSPTQ